MADYEGFLLLHDLGHHADPLYFELAGGMLAYYTKKGGRWLGEFSLTRHRVVARLLPSPVGTVASQSPHRFTVELCPVRSVHDTERSLKGFRRATVLLSGSTPDVARRWVHAIQTWRRRNWRDTVVIADFEDELKALRLFMSMHQLEPKITRGSALEGTAALRKVEMAPELAERAQDKRLLASGHDERASFGQDKRNLMLAARSGSHLTRLSFHGRPSAVAM